MSILGRTDVCGTWGFARFFDDAIQTYCNRKPGHDGQCSYKNSRGNEWDLFYTEAGRDDQ